MTLLTRNSPLSRLGGGGRAHYRIFVRSSTVRPLPFPFLRYLPAKRGRWTARSGSRSAKGRPREASPCQNAEGGCAAHHRVPRSPCRSWVSDAPAAGYSGGVQRWIPTDGGFVCGVRCRGRAPWPLGEWEPPPGRGSDGGNDETCNGQPGLPHRRVLWTCPEIVRAERCTPRSRWKRRAGVGQTKGAVVEATVLSIP